MPASPSTRASELPQPEEAAKRHSERLAAAIHAQIESAGGWIPFEDYMEMALYAPGLGYYVAGAAKLGAAGDFVTAPEISPLFGKALANQAVEILAQAGDTILELGAGSGALAAQLLLRLERLDQLPQRYLILEVSPGLVQRQRQTLAAQVPGLLERIEWIASPPTRLSGVVLANEVLDALPVHLLSWRKEGLFERGVASSAGRFRWAERPLAEGPLLDAARSLPVRAPYQSELSLAVPALVREIAGILDKGALLLLDYGFGRAEYYHPQRSQGTLMCHYRHRAHGDPYFLPGLQDITAHVDFSAVAEAGVDAGLRFAGYATQAQFLINCGITRLLEEQASAPAAEYLPLAAGAQKLLSPAEMGELFKAIALVRGIDAPLGGFAAGSRSRLL